MCWLAKTVSINVAQTSSFKSELAVGDAQQENPGTMSSFIRVAPIASDALLFCKFYIILCPLSGVLLVCETFRCYGELHFPICRDG